MVHPLIRRLVRIAPMLGLACALGGDAAHVTVLDMETGRPVAGAVLTISGGGSTWEAETGVDGVARVSGIKPGFYRAQVECPGFVDPSDAGSDGRHQYLSSDGRAAIGLVRAAAVAGTVQDEAGRAVSGIGVHALRRIETGGGVRWTTTGLTGHTDDEGRYRLHGLPPGIYAIAAHPSDEGTPGARGGPAFYPSGTDLSTAELIELKPGDERHRIDIRMAAAASGGIIGTLAGIDQAWAGGRAEVAVVPQSGVGLAVAHAMTDAEGRFRFDGIPAGQYMVLAWGPPTGAGYEVAPQGGQARFAFATLETRGGETAETALRLAPGVTLEAAWEASDCKGLDSLEIKPEGDWFSHWEFKPVEGSNAKRWANLPAGTYRFEMPGIEKSCAFLGVRSAQGETPKPLACLLSPAKVELVVERSSGEVSVRILKSGKPVAPSRVLLLAEDGRAATWETVCAGDGQFRFTGLPPGKYVAIGYGQAKADGGGDASETEPRIQRFTLERGQRIEIHLNLAGE